MTSLDQLLENYWFVRELDKEKYEIIKLKNDGWSSRRISKTFGISRNTIKKYWGEYQDNLNLLISADASEIDKRKVTEEIIEKTKYDSSNRHARKYSFEMDQALRKILDDPSLNV